MNEFLVLAGFQFAIGIYALVRKKYLAQVQKKQSVGKSGPPYDYLNSVSEQVLERNTTIAGFGFIGIGAAILLFTSNFLADNDIDFDEKYIFLLSMFLGLMVLYKVRKHSWFEIVGIIIFTFLSTVAFLNL